MFLTYQLQCNNAKVNIHVEKLMTYFQDEGNISLPKIGLASLDR